MTQSKARIIRWKSNANQVLLLSLLLLLCGGSCCCAFVGRADAFVIPTQLRRFDHRTAAGSVASASSSSIWKSRDHDTIGGSRRQHWPVHFAAANGGDDQPQLQSKNSNNNSKKKKTLNSSTNSNSNSNSNKKNNPGKAKSKGKTKAKTAEDREKEKKALMKSVQAKMKEQRSGRSSSSSSSSSQQKQRAATTSTLDAIQQEAADATSASSSSQQQQDQQQQGKSKDNSILSNLNPFQAGQNLRKTLDSFTTNLGGLPEETRQKYYLDDRVTELSLLSSPTQRTGSLERLLERDDYIPEVLVVGATGEVGRRVVRRLLVEGRFRVRVLVRDLYSETLNLFGTGVTYCQGDLSNMESLEYALTDVDKIVFCAGAPKPDEDDFKKNFETFVQENLKGSTSSGSNGNIVDGKTHSSGSGSNNRNGNGNANGNSMSNMEWEQLDYVLELRSKLAEQVDLIGMGNLVRAYQNVRHADYGTSQAAKRSLFKFSSRQEDFALFAIDETDDDDFEDDDDDSDDDNIGSDYDTRSSSSSSNRNNKSSNSNNNNDDDNYKYGGDDNYEDYYGDYDGDDYDDYDDDGNNNNAYGGGTKLEQRKDATSQTQCRWLRNSAGSGVFVGKVPKSDGGMEGEAAIISSRLRARDNPENGIDLGSVFAGMILRAISDGSNYEAFIRTSAYDSDGIEYVCQFSTQTKAVQTGNKSRNKAVTVRLPFENFVPVLKRSKSSSKADGIAAEPFTGSDIRYIGFRYRSANNEIPAGFTDRGYIKFYLAMRHIKVYRQQPEPEFVYLSDARIPKSIPQGTVRHDLQQLLTAADPTGLSAGSQTVSSGGGTVNEAVQIMNDGMLSNADNQLERTKSETYFKYRGEEILKNSGLSYTIIRVAGFNELMSGEASTIDLNSAGGQNIVPVSRDEAAQVCVGALMDPNALNKSVYMGKQQSGGQKRTTMDEDIGAKFAALPTD